MTEFNFTFKLDPATVQKITEIFASIPAAFTELTPKTREQVAGVFANISLDYLRQQPAFARSLADRLDAREADRILADVAARYGYTPAQVADLNAAIRFSQVSRSAAATAEFISLKASEDIEFQKIIDDVLGN